MLTTHTPNFTKNKIANGRPKQMIPTPAIVGAFLILASCSQITSPPGPPLQLVSGKNP